MLGFKLFRFGRGDDCWDLTYILHPQGPAACDRRMASSAASRFAVGVFEPIVEGLSRRQRASATEPVIVGRRGATALGFPAHARSRRDLLFGLGPNRIADRSRCRRARFWQHASHGDRRPSEPSQARVKGRTPRAKTVLAASITASYPFAVAAPSVRRNLTRSQERWARMFLPQSSRRVGQAYADLAERLLELKFK